MADSQSSSTIQSERQQTDAPQHEFDTVFANQVAGVGGYEIQREAWRAYFNLAEQTVRTAREVTELQTLQLMRQAIVSDVTRQVIAQIKADPSLKRELSS